MHNSQNRKVTLVAPCVEDPSTPQTSEEAKANLFSLPSKTVRERTVQRKSFLGLPKNVRERALMTLNKYYTEVDLGRKPEFSPWEIKNGFIRKSQQLAKEKRTKGPRGPVRQDKEGGYEFGDAADYKFKEIRKEALIQDKSDTAYQVRSRKVPEERKSRGKGRYTGAPNPLVEKNTFSSAVKSETVKDAAKVPKRRVPNMIWEKMQPFEHRHISKYNKAYYRNPSMKYNPPVTRLFKPHPSTSPLNIPGGSPVFGSYTGDVSYPHPEWQKVPPLNNGLPRLIEDDNRSPSQPPPIPLSESLPIPRVRNKYYHVGSSSRPGHVMTGNEAYRILKEKRGNVMHPKIQKDLELKSAVIETKVSYVAPLPPLKRPLLDYIKFRQSFLTVAGPLTDIKDARAQFLSLEKNKFRIQKGLEALDSPNPQQAFIDFIARIRPTYRFTNVVEPVVFKPVFLRRQTAEKYSDQFGSYEYLGNALDPLEQIQEIGGLAALIKLISSARDWTTVVSALYLYIKSFSKEVCYEVLQQSVDVLCKLTDYAFQASGNVFYDIAETTYEFFVKTEVGAQLCSILSSISVLGFMWNLGLMKSEAWMARFAFLKSFLIDPKERHVETFVRRLFRLMTTLVGNAKVAFQKGDLSFLFGSTLPANQWVHYSYTLCDRNEIIIDLARVAAETTFKRNLANGDYPTQITEQLLREEVRDRLVHLMDMLPALRLAYADEPEVLKLIVARGAANSTWLRTYESDKTNGKARVQPLVFFMYGGAGVGKSTFVRYLHRISALALDLPIDESDIFRYQPGMNFQDSFRQSMYFFLADDIDTNPQLFPQNDHVRVAIEMINNAPLNMEAASLTAKGNHWANFLTGAWCTNRADGGIKGLTVCPLAFWRRFPYKIDLQPKAIYCCGSPKDGEPRVLDGRKIPPNTHELWETITIFTSRPDLYRDTDKVQNGPYELLQVFDSAFPLRDSLLVIKGLIKTWVEAQRARLQPLDLTDMCSHCGIPGYHVCGPDLSSVPLFEEEIESERVLIDRESREEDECNSSMMRRNGHLAEALEQLIADNDSAPEERLKKRLTRAQPPRQPLFDIYANQCGSEVYADQALSLYEAYNSMKTWPALCWSGMVFPFFLFFYLQVYLKCKAVAESYIIPEWMSVVRKISKTIEANKEKLKYYSLFLTVFALTAASAAALANRTKFQDQSEEDDAKEPLPVHFRDVATWTRLPVTTRAYKEFTNPGYNVEYLMDLVQRERVTLSYKGRTVCGIDTGRGWVLTVRHFLCLTPNGRDGMIDFNLIPIYLSRGDTERHEFLLEPQRVIEVPGRDLVLIFAPELVPRSVVWKLITTSQAVPGLAADAAFMATKGLGVQKARAWTSNEYKTITTNLIWKTRMESSDGDCGNLLVCSFNKAFFVVGMHVARALNAGETIAEDIDGVLINCLIENNKRTNPPLVDQCLDMVKPGVSFDFLPLPAISSLWVSLSGPSPPQGIVYGKNTALSTTRFTSNVVPMPFREKWAEMEMKICGEVDYFVKPDPRGHMDGDKWVDPFVVNLEGSSNKPGSITTWEAAADDYLKGFENLVGLSAVVPLTENEALAGIMETNTGKVDINTSFGPPYNVQKKHHMQFDENRVPLISPIFRAQLDELQSCLERGEMVSPFANHVLKDEAISRKKQESKKIRVFNVFSAAFNVKLKQYLGGIAGLMRRHPYFFETAIGMDVTSYQWADLLQYLDVFPNWGCADNCFFDVKESTIEWLMVVDVLMRMAKLCSYTELDLRCMKGILMSCTYVTRNIKGDIIRTSHMMPTGFWVTIIVNCIRNCLQRRYAFIVLRPPGLEVDFRDGVRQIVLGDDNVNTTCWPWFNQKAIQAVVREFGAEMTAADKSPEVALFDAKESVTFLKRRFVVEDGVCKAPIELKTLIRMATMRVASKVESELDQIAVIYGNLLSEAHFHGADVFNDFANIIDSIAEELSLTQTNRYVRRDYEYYVKLYKENKLSVWQPDF